jgi:hypothetical protein
MIAPPRRPADDELEALIKEARERQLRKRLLGAAAVAIASALGLALYALTIGGAPDTSTGSSQGARTPLCQSPQLSTSFLPGGSAGTALGPLFIQNTSGQACAIPDVRPVVQFTFRGRVVPIAERSWSAADQLGKPARPVLAPRTKIYVELGWRGSCPHPTAALTQGAVSVTLRLGGLTLFARESTPEGVPSVPGCSEVIRPVVEVSRPLIG